MSERNQKNQVESDVLPSFFVWSCIIAFVSFLALIFVLGLSYSEFGLGVSTTDHDLLFHDTCTFKGCNNPASSEVYFLRLMDSSAKRVPDNENYILDWSDRTRTDIKSYTKKETYLVPTEEGLKVENKRKKVPISIDKVKVGDNLEIHGYYCEEHAAKGEQLIKHAVETAIIWTNPFLWIWLIVLVCSIVRIVVYKVAKK